MVFVALVLWVEVEGEILQMIAVIEKLVALEMVNSDFGDTIPVHKGLICILDNTLILRNLYIKEQPSCSSSSSRSCFVLSLA